MQQKLVQHWEYVGACFGLQCMFFMCCVYPEELHMLTLPSTSPNSALLRRALGLGIQVERHLHVSEEPVLAVLNDL